MSFSHIKVETEVETDHHIHRDDLPKVREEMRRHLRGDSPIFLSEHRIQDDSGQWIWVRARGPSTRSSLSTTATSSTLAGCG